MKWLLNFLLVLFVLLGLCSCSSGSDGDSAAGPDPQGLVTPENLSTINAQSLIIVRFNVAMDASSLSVSGTLTSAMSAGVWSASFVNNDTLTFSPTTSWSEGNQSLAITILDTKGVTVAGLDLQYTVDATSPTAIINPVSGSVIRGDTNVVITFSETIKTSAMTASGTLWSESNQGSWTSSVVDDDTLTLMPITSWSEGAKNIGVNVTDWVNNPTLVVFNYSVDSTLPAASVTPASNLTLTPDMSIVFSFTETMDINSLLATGTLWGESDLGVWSTTINANDTFIISPATNWSMGDKTLNVDINDLVGNPLNSMSFTYTVGCAIGLTNCNGTCVDTSSDLNNCGACDSACAPRNNANLMCSDSNCMIESCDIGFSDCNSVYGDGCEANILTDMANCGACNNSCNDSVACTADACTSGSCDNLTNDSVCGTDTACTNFYCDQLLGCAFSHSSLGVSCGEVIGTWGTCGGYTSTCDETGTQSRTITPLVCDGSGSCVSGTPYSETQSCTRNTDGLQCGPTSECFSGICINLLL